MPLTSTFLRTSSIGLKIAEIVLALIYISVVSYQTSNSLPTGDTVVCEHTKVVSFVVITSGFVVPTFLLLVNDLHRESAEHQRKTLYPILYNISAVLFHAVASMTILTYSERFTSGPGVGSFRAGGIMGLLNSVFYTGSAVVAFIAYRTD